MMLRKLPLLMMGAVVIALPGLIHAAEPLNSKAMSGAYLPGTPPQAAKCTTYDSKREGRVGDNTIAPCPALQQKPPSDPAPENLVDRALIDSMHSTPPNATLNQQPLLDNTAQPGAAAIENRGNVMLLFPTVTTPNPQGGSGGGTSVQAGPNGTIIQLHPFR